MAKKKQAAPKATVAKRSLNAGGPKEPVRGAPGQEQDPKRRLGNFTGTGEHARQNSPPSGKRGSKK